MDSMDSVRLLILIKSTGNEKRSIKKIALLVFNYADNLILRATGVIVKRWRINTSPLPKHCRTLQFPLRTPFLSRVDFNSTAGRTLLSRPRPLAVCDSRQRLTDDIPS